MNPNQSLRGVVWVTSVEDSTWGPTSCAPRELEIVINLGADKNGLTHHFHELLSYN